MPISPTLVAESKIMLVGEAPGKSEEMLGRPFVGSSGQELDSMLAEAGIDRNACSLTNVFLERPPSNDLKKWMVTKKEGYGCPIAKGKYFTEALYAQRQRLYNEIAQVQPNIIVALGNTAAWALLDKTGITALRGVVARSPYTSAKILPTYHPAAILRQYEFRSTAVVDLVKALRESESREIVSPDYTCIIEPTQGEIREAYLRFKECPLLSYDIETAIGQITCIGFACKGFAITIPLVSFNNESYSYWSHEEEVSVWKLIRLILELPCKKVTQNGLYDIQYLYKYGVRPKNSQEDTMLLHHSIMPELPKSLAFLASVYTNFPSWKNMRPKGIETNKKEE